MTKAFELDPNSSQAHLVLGLAYEQKSMFSRAVAEFPKAKNLSPGTAFALSDLAHVYAVSGKRVEAMKILNELEGLSKRRYVPANYRAIIYAGLGEKDEAFAWLQKAFEEHSYWLSTLKMDPRLDSLRSHPRFHDLIRRIGLPP